MKYLLFVFLLCSVTVNAQNQVVRHRMKQHSSVMRKTGINRNTQTVQNSHSKTKKNSTPVIKRTETTGSSTADEERNRISAAYSNGMLTVNGVRYEFVKVGAGTFTMGGTSEMKDAEDDEKPVHQVTLTEDYYIGKTEVTQALWKEVMGSNPSYFKGNDKPVEQVSWNDCQMFVSKLNAATSKKFRLPTEAEWEFAARGGNKSKHYQYSGSDNIDNVAWYEGNSGSCTHDVATKQPNELGIYDMSGNIWEWCQDWHGNYDSSVQTNPKGTSGNTRVGRGGSWKYDSNRCRSSARDGSFSDFSYITFGLRLCISE